jgi:Family of unknown function (DUF6516)
MMALACPRRLDATYDRGAQIRRLLPFYFSGPDLAIDRYGAWRHMVVRTILGRVMKAGLLFHQHIDYEDGAIVEMVLWRVPSPVSPSTHGLKYRLYYGRPGVREVGYDNEHGKGDHRHFQAAETPYAFSTVEQLMADFWFDVRSLRGGK